MMNMEIDYNHVVMIIVCPMAIAYSMGQIIKPVCASLSVYLCICLWALS